MKNQAAVKVAEEMAQPFGLTLDHPDDHCVTFLKDGKKVISFTEYQIVNHAAGCAASLENTLKAESDAAKPSEGKRETLGDPEE